MKILLMNNFQSFIYCGKKNVWKLNTIKLALKLAKCVCIPYDINTVLTVLISKPTKYFTVLYVTRQRHVFLWQTFIFICQPCIILYPHILQVWHLITLLLFRLDALKSSNEDLDEFMSSREQGFINRYNLISRSSGNSRVLLVCPLIFCWIFVNYWTADCYFFTCLSLFFQI